MTRALHKLSDAAAKSSTLKGGRHSDGGGLYLNVTKSGSKSWLFMWQPIGGKRHEMGLGQYPSVTLAIARAKAAEYRQMVATGRDPLAEKRKEVEPTFAGCVDSFLSSMEGQWRNPKHRAQWRMTLTEYCRPIAALKVSAVGTEQVLQVLNPIWTAKPETASRLRGRIERVLDFAKVKGWRSGENPALWRGHLKNVLPARRKLTRGHHAAMPYAQVPAFIERLRGLDAMSARALEFLILTAARSGEVLEAKWSEFDLDAGLWIVPAARMKAGKEHRVPLSKPALAIVKALHELRISDFVFPGHVKGRPLSNMAFAKLLERMKAETIYAARLPLRLQGLGRRRYVIPPRGRGGSLGASGRGRGGKGLPKVRCPGEAPQAHGGMGRLLRHREGG